MVLFTPLTTCNFWCYSGAGNQFLLTHDLLDSNCVRYYCQEHQVDGVLCVQSSSVAHARLIIFNNDGSRPTMCGNGLRCTIAHLACELGCESLSVETDQGVYKGQFVSWDRVLVDMTLPDWHCSHHELCDPLPGMPARVSYIHTGVPHLVMFHTNIKNLCVHTWGSFLRNHEIFAPEGANVNFVQQLSPCQLCIRTYERGLERESLACGTGALASALVAGFQKGNSIEVRTWSQMVLRISAQHERIFVEGPVQRIF